MPQFCVNNEVSSSLSLRMAMYSCALTRPSSGSLFFFVLFVCFFWGSIDCVLFSFQTQTTSVIGLFCPSIWLRRRPARDIAPTLTAQLKPHFVPLFGWRFLIRHQAALIVRSFFILSFLFFNFRCNTCVCFNSFLFAPHFSFVMEQNKRAHGAYPTISFI